MDLIQPLIQGATLLLDPLIIFLIVVGTLWGVVGGAMPGVNGPIAMGVMIPFTFLLDSVEAVAFLVAIMFGVGYGNQIPAVLVGVPGTTSAFLTSIDGFALHKRGESGLALGAAYFGTVTSQWIGVLALTVAVVPLSQLAYSFLAPELFALYFLGMAAVVSLTGKNVLKGLMAGSFGILVSLIGRDPVSQQPRFDFGIFELRNGLETVPIVIGLIAVGELLRALRQVHGWGDMADTRNIRFPKLREYTSMVKITLSSSVIGVLIGAIPGLGSTPASFVAYQQAKFFSKKPEDFGHGSVDAIVANEAAGAASNAGELIPTLGLGVPGSTSAALLLGALTIHGLIAGPLLLTYSPELLNATLAGAIGGTILVAVAGAVIARRVLRVALLDRRAILICAMFMTVVGSYAVRRAIFDVWVLLIFSLVGYFMLRYGFSTPAAALGLILGRGFEANLRQGLILSHNSVLEFVTRRWTLPLLLVAFAFLGWGLYSGRKINQRDKAYALRQLDADGRPPPGAT